MLLGYGSWQALVNVVKAVLTGTEVVKNVNKNNASHAVLFEALALVMHLDYERELVKQCLLLLGKFISVREPNIRYLGLENMCRLSLIPECLPSIRSHLKTIISSLKVSPLFPQFF
jgi:AP-2 complex subunit alpha